MMYLGDYAEDETVYFLWSTNAADGSSITRATNGTVSVYKDNGTTQTTTGVTDTEDFDTLTGIHACTIATTDAFYTAATDYSVVLSGATIDGKTVNAVLAHFSIQNRYMRGTDSANTTTPPTVGAIADQVWDEALSGHTTAGSAGKSLADTEADAATAAAASAPSAATVADAVWDEALASHLGLGSTGAALNNAGGAATDPWNTELPGSYTAGEAGYILGTFLDQKISLTNASPGAGAIQFTYTLTEAGSGDPIPDADVWATSDSAGSTVLASGRTDVSGEVTFYLDAGTVYIWRQKAGWDFVNPQVGSVGP
jgi:hypothetical protein